MKVHELATQIKLKNEDILETLKSIKLKAKDGDQELSMAVVSVIKSELAKQGKIVLKKKVVRKKKPVVVKEKEIEKDVEATTTTKDKVEKKEEKAIEKVEPVVVIETKKEIVKKTDKAKEKIAEKKEPDHVVADKKIDSKKLEAPKAVVEKTTFVSNKGKSKPRISKDPIITLKPLARKKRKNDGAGDGSSRRNDQYGEKNEEIAKSPIPVGELKDIEVKVPITVKDLSIRMQEKPSAVLKELMKMGIFAHINQGLDENIVMKILNGFGYNLINIKTQEQLLVETHKQEEEDPSQLEFRAPVVTFMGHVDHGKTSLLDKIRKSKVTDTEHGGITQHMGAYSVEVPRGRITFLDTPGHEAFTAMRKRGAHITDLVVLVVAADEGIMPQTEEAIDHARAANVPIIVALNKIDRKNADVDKVKQQLAKYNLAPSDWGGTTSVVGVSAMTGEGIDELLEMMLLEAEMLELKANANKKATGIVVEAHLSQGKGAVTTLIVQSGTLNEGEYIVVGQYCGKARALFNDHKKLVKLAGPSMPVEMLGLSDVPDAGETFYVVEDERTAREITMRRQLQLKKERLDSGAKVTLEDLYSHLEDGQFKELNIIVKADVQGSLEALKDSLAKIPSDKVRIKFIHTAVGEINASDVILAAASKAIIIAFQVGVGSRAKEELEKDPVDIREYRIIYDAVDDIRNALEGLLEAKVKKNFQCRIEVREVFKLSKQGIVAGCYIKKGKAIRKSHADLIRNGEVVYSGIVSSLKRFKDDVREVNENMECGVTLENFDKYQVGDIIETFTVEKIAQKL